MIEKQAREAVVNVIKGWLGWSESDGRYRKIIDLYNSQKPLPVGYKVKYTDDWCAVTVTASFLKAGLADIHFPECSCPRMIEKYKKAGRWMERDSYIPQPGDLILYDWEDDGRGDNTGQPNHVGMVMGVSGGYIQVIEGNRGNAVCYRWLKVDGRYIRGFCLPDFASSTKYSEVLTNFESEKEDVMTEEKIRQIVRDEVQKIQNELATEPASSWAGPFWKEATEKGIVDGSRPRSTVTRQEAATMILKVCHESH